MKQGIVKSAMFLVFIFIAANAADTLFYDNFQVATVSKPQWAFPDSVTSDYSNSAVTLHNKDANYTWFVTRNMSKTPTFTLSATFTLTPSASNGVGIVCCKTDTSGVAIQLGTQQNVYAYRYSRSGSTTLLNTFNSFITKTSNVLTVSKKDSTFTIFCNGNYIGDVFISSPLYTAGGDIAIALSPQTTATFYGVVMTATYTPGIVRTCFLDEFSDDNTLGWYTYTMNGSVQPQGGKLLASNADAAYSGLLFVNGDFKRSSMKIITEFKQGAGAYGCMFVYTKSSDSGNSYGTYSFIIDSTKRYGVGLLDSSGLKMNTPKTYIHGATGDGKDTIQILRFGNKYKFSINGTIAEDSLPLPARAPDGAGLYLGPKTSVYFDMFAVGGDSTGASCPVHAASWTPEKQFYPLIRPASNSFIVFDALGRLNKRFDGVHWNGLQKSAREVYFVRPATKGDDCFKTVTIIK